MDKEFTREELDKIDLLHNIAYDAIVAVLGYSPEWDIHFIAPVADAICNTIVENFGKTEMEIYPYRDSE